MEDVQICLQEQDCFFFVQNRMKRTRFGVSPWHDEAPAHRGVLRAGWLGYFLPPHLKHILWSHFSSLFSVSRSLLFSPPLPLPKADDMFGHGSAALVLLSAALTVSATHGDHGAFKLAVRTPVTPRSNGALEVVDRS